MLNGKSASTSTPAAPLPDSEPTELSPATLEPATQEPANQEPANQEPANQEPANQEPATQAPAPHRLKRYRSIYNHLLPRVRELGALFALRDRNGHIITGDLDHLIVAASPPPEPSVAGLPSSVVTAGHVWVPLGAGRPDAWLFATGGEADPATLARLIEWAMRDADRIHRLEEGNAQIGDRLAENYEQMHVLFGLARVLDGVEDVAAGVARVLDAIRAGMPFSWLAVRFARDSRLRSGMAGGFIFSGSAPATPDEIERGCAHLMRMEDLTGIRMIFPGDSTGLTERLGTELAAAPVRFEGRTVGVLLAGGKSGDDAPLTSFETQFLAACADLLSVFHENLTRFSDQRDLFMGTVRALTSAIDAKHRYTRGHSERVALLARETARAIGLGEQAAQTYHLAGLLHDVGKIGVPEAILSKPTRLTDDEFEAIKRHPGVGHDILRGIPNLEDVLPGVLHHHESFAGTGYPDRLAGHDIPLVARVLALADTFDAMSSSRSYRASLSRAEVLAEIRRCSGTQFDPELAEAFLKLDFSAFDALFSSHEENCRLAA